jgi:hypothetical protein
MGIRRTVEQKESVQTKTEKKVELNEEEINFIVAKLRKATYTGYEFEQFYDVILKLQDMVKKE